MAALMNASELLDFLLPAVQVLGNCSLDEPFQAGPGGLLQLQQGFVLLRGDLSVKSNDLRRHGCTF